MSNILSRTMVGADAPTGEEPPDRDDQGPQSFESIADSIPAMLWLANTGNHRAFFSTAWLAFAGRPREAEAADGWVDRVHPDDVAPLLSVIATAFQRRKPFEVEYRLHRYDGSVRWIVDSGAPRVADGRFCGYAGFALDITERREAEQRRSVGGDLYRALAEAMPALVLTTSADGEVEFCNEQLLEYCGATLDDLQGAKWVDFIHPDDIAAGRNQWLRRLQRMTHFSTEYRIRRADGAYRWHLTRTGPLRDAAGSVRAWIGVSVDIDDRRRAENEKERIAAELLRANAAKDDFLALVSHELRTPLTTVYGNAQILARMGDKLSPDEVKASIADVESEAIRLQQLIDDMFVLARNRFDERELAEPVLLGRTVLRIQREHAQRYPERTIDVVDEVGSLPVHGDVTHIEQVIRNLLHNAEKFSPPRQPIEVSLDRSDGLASIRILNRGSGFDEDELEHMFEMFYRGPRTAGHVPGAGIGLSVCKQLVEGHGGEIWARPRPGGGAEVGFTLPLEATEAMDEQ